MAAAPVKRRRQFTGMIHASDIQALFKGKRSRSLRAFIIAFVAVDIALLVFLCMRFF